MLILEEFKAIINRIRAGNKTEADKSISRRSLRQTGETVQFEAEQGKFIDIAQIIDSDVQCGDRTSALPLRPSLRYVCVHPTL